MDRRLKDRVPAALRAGKKRLPALVLVVTTTLTIAPDAWARVLAGEGKAQVVTKTYTKEELKQTVPANPAPDLDERLKTEVTGVLNKIAGGLSDPKRRQTLDGLRTKNATPGSADADKNPTQSQVEIPALRSFFGLETQKVVRNEVRENMTFYNKLVDAFKTNINLGGMFKKSDDTPPPNTGSVRYGLVVRDIVPDSGAKGLASINDTADEMQYAGHADVKWTIGPLDEAQSRKVFDGVGGNETASTSESNWNLKLPTPNFRTEATPENFDDYSKVDKNALPNMRLQLIQSEEYYALSYRTTMQGKRLGVEHNFKVPVAGTVALGRRFSDNFKLVETSAYNILYDKRLPMLSVHEMHIEQRLKADLSTNIGTNQTVGIGARGEAKGVVEKPEDKPEQYNVNYTRTF